MPAFLWIKFLLYKMCLNIKSLIPNCTVQVSSTVTISSSQDAYGTWILALIKTSMKTLCLIFLKYRFFGINFRGKVTILVHLSCNKIQNIYLSFTKFLPLNSLHHSKFLDDTGQFLLNLVVFCSISEETWNGSFQDRSRLNSSLFNSRFQEYKVIYNCKGHLV